MHGEDVHVNDVVHAHENVPVNDVIDLVNNHVHEDYGHVVENVHVHLYPVTVVHSYQLLCVCLHVVHPFELEEV